VAQKISLRLLALCLGLMVVAVSARGQDYKPLLGKWSMTSESSEDPVKWTLTLKESEGKLTGTLGTADGEQPAKDLTFVDGVLKFQAPYQGSFYNIELKSTTPEKLEGTWDGGGDSGKTYGTKN
jgi:hypothetical protein